MTTKPILSAVILVVFVGASTISEISWALDSPSESSMKVQEQNLSSSAAKSKQLVTKDAVESQAIKPVHIKKTAVSIVTMAELLPPGFRDEDDDSSLPYLLTPTELKKFGVRREIQEIPKLDRRAMAALVRETPILKVRIHAILTANSDGTDPVTISPQQIKQLVDQTNRVWWSSGIEFLFDPEKDVEMRNNTLLHQKLSLEEYEGIKNDPNRDPNKMDASQYHEARTQAALEIRGKLVVFFSNSIKFKWDETDKVWNVLPAGGFSGYNLEYVFMPKGMPEKNLLAHEIGHYLHLPHPFVSEIETVDDARQAIRDWVEKQSHPAKQGLLVFDADNRVRSPDSYVDIKDTPPDPDGQIFNSAYGAGAKCSPSYKTVQVDVLFSNGYQAMYTLEPDRLNIMSYYKGCHNLGTHHVSAGQIAVSRNALTNGNRMHLLTPTIERRAARQKVQ